MITALLLATLAQGASWAESPPRLPAPMAWLVDQDDCPLVSRRVAVLDPGGEAPRTVLEPVLYCFDAADHQAVGWAGERLLVNGPVTRSRSMPNVAMPLALVDSRDGTREELGVAPDGFVASPDGLRVLCSGTFELQGVDLEPGEPRELLGRSLLGQATLRGATWTEDGRAALAVVHGSGAGLESGLWRIALDGSEPRRVGPDPGWLRDGPVGGALLFSRRVERETYTPHELVRLRLGSREAPEAVARDLHWNQSAAIRPGTGEVAYVRSDDGAIVLLGAAPDAAPRVLLSGPHAAGSLAWSPDGRWLAFDTLDVERTPWVGVVDVEQDELHRLGDGLRPAWGPLAR